MVDLYGATLREKRAVGKIGAEQQQQTGLMGRIVAGAVPQETAHPDVVRVVPLNPLLAAQGVPDRTIELTGQPHHEVVGPAHSDTTEQRHGGCRVQAVGEPVDLILAGDDRAPRGYGSAALAGRMLRVPVKHVARHDEHRYAGQPDGVLDGDAREPRHLRGLAHELAIVTAVHEHALGMSLLKEGGADLLGGDVRGYREHRRPAPVGVVEPLDQMRVPRAATARTDGKPPRELSLGGRGKSGGLFVADVDPFDTVRSADRIHERIETIADDAEDAGHAGLAEDLDELVTDGAHARHGTPATKSARRGGNSVRSS